MTRPRRRPPLVSRHVAWLAVVVALAQSPQGLAQVPDVGLAPPLRTATEPSQVVPADPYTWRGHEEAIEASLRHGVITHIRDIPVGITKPRRAYLAPGGAVSSMAWKPLPNGVLHGKMESYRSEIAAYLLSRHLGLDMVPPVVEREIHGVKGAAVFWIEGVKAWDPASPPRAPGANWARQTSRMFMFDQLIANIDRNQGNLLYDEAGHVFLIDHSRAFTSKPDLVGLPAPQQFDPALWGRIDALTHDELERVLGPWLTGPQVEAVVTRRDAMRRHVARQVRERGASVTFLPPVPRQTRPPS